VITSPPVVDADDRPPLARELTGEERGNFFGENFHVRKAHFPVGVDGRGGGERRHGGSERNIVGVDRGRVGLRYFRLRLLVDDAIRRPVGELARLRIEPGRHLADLVDLAGRRGDRLLEGGDEALEIDLLVARGGFESIENLICPRRRGSLRRLGGSLGERGL
jgi:hypothetical protein